jgi:hypothetical protein
MKLFKKRNATVLDCDFQIKELSMLNWNWSAVAPTAPFSQHVYANPTVAVT